MKSIPMLIESSNNGDKKASLLLYYLFYLRKDSECRRFLEVAINQGSISARYEYAIHLLQGDLYPEDSTKAVMLLEECANRGHSDAIDQLIYMYSVGYKISKSNEKAEQWRTRKQTGFSYDGSEIKVNPSTGTEETVSHYNTDNDNQYDELRQILQNKASSTIKALDITSRLINEIDKPKICFVLNNPAECAFISEQLLKINIQHSINAITSERIIVYSVHDLKIINSNIEYLISNSVLQSDSIRELSKFKNIQEIKSFHIIDMGDHEFSELKLASGCRWICRNSYSVTHVNINIEDIEELNLHSDGIYPISFVEDENSYLILSKNGAFLGRLKEEFVDVIDDLKASDEIVASPAVINGISLRITGDKIEILGMGHLKYIED